MKTQFEVIEQPNTFKNEHLSVSRVKLFETCAFSFYCRYVKKGEEAMREPASAFGNVLHAALERAYQWAVEGWYAGPFPIAELLEFYRDEWAKSQLVGVSMYQEGVDMLRTYAASHPIVDHVNVLAVEQEFNVRIGEFLVNGYIDRADRVGPESVRVIDYKSNRILFSRDELEDDLQFTIYGIVAEQLWPWATEFEFEFHMLRHDRIQGVARTPEQLDRGAEYLISLGRRSELKDQKWPQTANPNCCYCDARNRCETYSKMLAGNHEYTKATDTKKFEEVVVEHYAISSIAKSAYGRKKTLEKALRVKLDKEGPFEIGNFSVQSTPTGSMTSYLELESTIKAFVENGYNEESVRARIGSANKSEIDKMLEESEETLSRGQHVMLKAMVEATAKRVPKSDAISVTKLKSDAKKPKEAAK